MTREAGSSVLGSRPDSEGDYSDSRLSDKERREILNRMLVHDEFLKLSEEEALKRFASSDEWLKAFADRVQNLDVSVCEPLCQFIEMRFGLKIPRKDRKRVHFDNLVFLLSQSITSFSREEIANRLGDGRLSPEDVDNKLDELLAENSRKKKK